VCGYSIGRSEARCASAFIWNRLASTESRPMGSAPGLGNKRAVRSQSARTKCRTALPGAANPSFAISHLKR
jgi:hypothetical protein